MTQHQQFIKERQYLSNVSPATLEWYRQSLAWLNTDTPTADDLKAFVIRMRQHGLKATACNCRIRAVNVFLKWAGSPLRVPKMKEPEFILPTFTAPQIKSLIKWITVTECRTVTYLAGNRKYVAPCNS